MSYTTADLDYLVTDINGLKLSHYNIDEDKGKQDYTLYIDLDFYLIFNRNVIKVLKCCNNLKLNY